MFGRGRQNRRSAYWGKLEGRSAVYCVQFHTYHVRPFTSFSFHLPTSKTTLSNRSSPPANTVSPSPALQGLANVLRLSLTSLHTRMIFRPRSDSLQESHAHSTFLSLSFHFLYLLLQPTHRLELVVPASQSLSAYSISDTSGNPSARTCLPISKLEPTCDEAKLSALLTALSSSENLRSLSLSSARLHVIPGTLLT